MDWGSLLLGLALLLLVAFIVAQPLFERGGGDERHPAPADHLLAERERVLEALRDLDFDHATGKLLDEDYTAQRARLVARGAALLKQLDALGVAAPAESTRSNGRAAPEYLAADAAAEIEQAVARLRARRADEAAEAIEAGVAQRRTKARGAGVCGQCGRPARAGDSFCSACGAPLGPVVDVEWKAGAHD